MEEVERLVASIAGASGDEKEKILATLEELCMGPNGDDVVGQIEKSARSQILTVQWELEELIEKVRPPAVEEPVEEEPAEDAGDPGEMRMVYNDPRGLVLHTNGDQSRWLATQVDPRTGQPQTFELHSSEVDQLRMQLMGSPYWV